MPKQAIAPRIIVEKKGGHHYAALGNYWAARSTPESAIGEVIRRHPEIPALQRFLTEHPGILDQKDDHDLGQHAIDHGNSFGLVIDGVPKKKAVQDGAACN